MAANPIVSSSLSPLLLKLVNIIAKATVTAPNGTTPIQMRQTVGGVTFGALDCTAVTVNVAFGPQTLVTISYPGSYSVQGYISETLLATLI